MRRGEQTVRSRQVGRLLAGVRSQGGRRVNSGAEGPNLHSCLRPALKLVLLAFDFSGLLKDREDERDACSRDICPSYKLLITV